MPPDYPLSAFVTDTQVYELHNAGDSTVEYEIDTTPLDALREQNYLMDILECLQPKGEIPPGGNTAVEFVFSPLEEKTYFVSYM